MFIITARGVKEGDRIVLSYKRPYVVEKIDLTDNDTVKITFWRDMCISVSCDALLTKEA